MTQIARWDIFCQVVDNLGDAGFCWRLAQELACAGLDITLWIDQPQVLELIAGESPPRVHVRSWREAQRHWAQSPPPQVLIETFGCPLPPSVSEALQVQTTPPLWINLEHLAFSPSRLRTHAMPSPQWRADLPPLPKWFFVPGWTPTSGGVLRESFVRQRQAQFDGYQWLSSRGWAPRGAEKVVMAFCYAQAPLERLLQAWSDQPLLVLVAAGTPIELAAQRLPGVRVIRLPWLAQREFDELLWSCDLNIVRGEDSLVRACWAAKPFLWQAYPRHDGGHLADVGAWLDVLKSWGGGPDLQGWEAQCWSLNGHTHRAIESPWPHVWALRQAYIQLRDRLSAQTTLLERLLSFVDHHRPSALANQAPHRT